MNRYQFEVAQMDRRHQLVVRTLSFVGAAALIVATLWSAGLPRSEWWASVHQRFDQPHRASPPSGARAMPAAMTPAEIPAAAQAGLSGTDSSISAPQQALYLVAAAPGRNKHEGTAQIGTSPQNPQTYVAGAVLVNGARLAEIHRDHVVLTRDGDALELYLANATNAGAAGRGILDTRNALGMVGGEHSRRSIPVAHVEDPLPEVIRVMAHYENDVLAGLEVLPGKHAGAFAALGLNSGDLIVAIDGAAIVDAEPSIDLLRTLTRGAALSVTVRRERSTRTLGLDGGIVAKALADSREAEQTQMAMTP